MALIKTYYFLAIACLNLYGIRAFTEEAGLMRDIELEQRLKFLNKTPIKSIELDYAIFDCVDIYKQPAFDHPLLKNHKIQMKPSSWHDISDKEDNETLIRKIRFPKFGQHLDCPYRTVPIRRTTKESIMRGKSLRNIQAQPVNGPDPNEYFAILEIDQDKRYKVTGGKASIDIQNPQCNEGEASGALIWLFTENNDGNVEDGISAGWMVDPEEYGNSSTHLEIQWLGKGGGCINLFCPGFVQISQSNPPGLLLTNISKYGGPLYTLPTWIYQDNVTKNWWLVIGTEHVGYWPRELFSTFDDGAKVLAYGGYAKAIPNQPSPPMGSGYTEKCDYNHTSFFCKLEYQITDQVLKGIYIPPRTHKTTKLKRGFCKNYVPRYSCKDSQELGYYFLYGGPRGNCPDKYIPM